MACSPPASGNTPPAIDTTARRFDGTRATFKSGSSALGLHIFGKQTGFTVTTACQAHILWLSRAVSWRQLRGLIPFASYGPNKSWQVQAQEQEEHEEADKEAAAREKLRYLAIYHDDHRPSQFVQSQSPTDLLL